MTLARRAVVALLSLMIGGAVNGYTRPPTSSQNANAAPAQTVQMNTAEALAEAAFAGDGKRIDLLLAKQTGHKALNEALFFVSETAPLTVGASPSGEMEELPVPKSYALAAELLLEKGASLEARNDDGATPLIAASSRGETVVVKLFLDKGAVIEARDNEGSTALISAACVCPIIDQPDTYDSVRLLLQRGANIEAKDKQGGTALMAATSWGRDSIVGQLLDKGAKIEARDNKGNTALLIAASGSALDKISTLQLLLARGANIEARNDNGDTALILAVSTRGYKTDEIVQTLLNGGVDVQAKNRQGHTALALATEKGLTEIIKILNAVMAKPH